MPPGGLSEVQPVISQLADVGPQVWSRGLNRNSNETEVPNTATIARRYGGLIPPSDTAYRSGSYYPYVRTEMLPNASA